MTAQDLLRPPRTYKLTVPDYLALEERGAFQGLRTELIEGEVIVMSPQTRRNMFVKAELAYRIRRALELIDNSLFVGSEGSVEMSDTSLPEPDIVLTSEPHGEGFVPLASVALSVEVAVTTLDYDLKRKAALYACNRVQEYWVVDAGGRVIHQLWAPAGDVYAERREVAFGGRIEAATISGLAVETTGL